jgi:hypothetical protein
MSDPFSYVNKINTTGLVYDLYPVTPNDSTDNVGTGNVAIGLYIETGGTVVILNKDGDERTIVVPDSFYLISSVSRVKSAGTTASGIHALVV